MSVFNKKKDQKSEEERTVTLVTQLKPLPTSFSSSKAVPPGATSAAPTKPYLSNGKGSFPEKPSSFHYVAQLKPLPTSYTHSTTLISKTPSTSEVLTPRKTNLSDAEGSFPEKPSTIYSTLENNLKPAPVYIFNNENFDNRLQFRNGSSQDVEALSKTFEQLKCKVEVIKDATVTKVKSMVDILKHKSFNENSALVIVVLTHGNRNDKLSAKDSEYSLNDDVIFPLLKNKTLMNKPKLVFVQACKGTMRLDGLKTDGADSYGSPNEIYKCYSTYEGYVSYRTEDGTPFIQTLCETLQKFGQTKDIDEIMTEVRTVVKATSHDGQIPSVTSTLTKKYVFGEYM